MILQFSLGDRLRLGDRRRGGQGGEWCSRGKQQERLIEHLPTSWFGEFWRYVEEKNGKMFFILFSSIEECFPAVF